MKNFLRLLGTGLVIIIILLFILFLITQTTELSLTTYEHSSWVFLSGFGFLACLLCTLVFFNVSLQKDDTPVLPEDTDSLGKRTFSSELKGDFSPA